MPFAVSSASSQFLKAPSGHASKSNVKPHDDVDDFLSSDLELSFASTMSLNSPRRNNADLSFDDERDEPMDISPAPVKTAHRLLGEKSLRSRATINDNRLFGRDLSNNTSANETPSHVIKSGTQRSALPVEWLSTSRPTKTTDENIFAPPPTSPIDAMDIDNSSFTVEQDLLTSSPPASAAPTIRGFNDLFYGSTSPPRLESPVGRMLKKRRSFSPESARKPKHDVFELPSSPGFDNSPSQHKLNRISSGPLFPPLGKPALQSLCAVSSKRPRRPGFPEDPVQSAYPIMDSVNDDSKDEDNIRPPAARRAFSAMFPPADTTSSDASISFDGPDMSSPAQAYTKRQQAKTLRRRDGTEDFRPLTGATGVTGPNGEQSPATKFLHGGVGMPGFGDNEAAGKILPCHRVREDGLMRIKAQTLNALLDGEFDSQIAEYRIVDCRFDYEYSGGHIPGAINVNTTSDVEELLLTDKKPVPCVSGDVAKKTVLVFHCEFSAQRAPTFAKHLRSKDRASNNHVYPRIHYPEVYVLEGGYCAYYKHSSQRCEPRGYVTMDDPNHANSRREDLDQFRKSKFGRTKSYAYGDGLGSKGSSQQGQLKRNTAPAAPGMFTTASTLARTRRNGSGSSSLATLPEAGNTTIPTDDEIDIGDSPCPPSNKGVMLSKAKKLSRVPFTRADTLDAGRMNYH